MKFSQIRHHRDLAGGAGGEQPELRHSDRDGQVSRGSEDLDVEGRDLAQRFRD